jgi:hypothetical protein
MRNFRTSGSRKEGWQGKKLVRKFVFALRTLAAGSKLVKRFYD